MNLAQLTLTGESLQELLGREYYLTLAGLKAEPEFSRIYERFDSLLSDVALDVARDSGSQALFEWVVGVRIGRKVAPYEERQLVREQELVLIVDGAKVPYLRVAIELANSPDRGYRMALDRARATEGSSALNGIRRDRFALEHAEMRRLGYPDYVDGVAALSGIDLANLGDLAETFLEQTSNVFSDSLAKLAKRRLGVGLGELVRADTAWTFRADQYDAAFPPDELVATARQQMGEMGLDIEQRGRVIFDTEEREGKQSRAFCVPVRVPEEVYLVMRPQGGHRDYRTLWHELGHAMHFSTPARDLPFEARWLGDSSVTEGFAMLWDHLTMDPNWLERYTELNKGQIRELVVELAVQELHLVRRYAAKLLYELSLHRSNFVGLGSEYAERLSEATLFEYSEGDYLIDVDPGFYSARYLRAWQMEARLSAALRERYDTDWFRNPQAGAFVRELMARGQDRPADRLIEEETGWPVAFEPVAARLEALLA
ncbi:MAG: hypothetical protein JSW71_14430 [Gemmatimonadota bacterium]|nr:MAG: hypothetical protein JSW71_14430 [Gemmatimonadota bacterium]